MPIVSQSTVPVGTGKEQYDMSVTQDWAGNYTVKGRYIQTDWDYPYAIGLLGYGLRRRGERCAHRGTDGTINCPDCGKTATKFIQEAAEILDRNC